MVSLLLIGDPDCIKEKAMLSKFMSAVVALLILIPFAEFCSDNLNRPRDRKDISTFTSDYDHECRDKSENIRTAVQRLASGEYSQIGLARNTLLGHAKHSAACRKAVITSIMESMDKPNLDFEKDFESYVIWREGSQLLGELGATEALDLLISHLDLTNGFHSYSKVFQPAILGVREMGPAAIPKLASALLQNSKPRIRIAAAYCLTAIGGASAMDALKQAKEREADQCVARFISVSLTTFSYESKGRILFNDAAPQANEDARRNWLNAFDCVN